MSSGATVGTQAKPYFVPAGPRAGIDSATLSDYGYLSERDGDDPSLRTLEQSLQPSVHGVEPRIECVGKRWPRVAFRDPAAEQPCIVGFESGLPVDGDADQRLLADPEAVVDRDMEPGTGPVLTDRPEIEQARIAPVPIQRFDRLGLPADNELDEGLDVRLLDQIAILGDRDQADGGFARFGHPVDGCGRQRSGVSRPGNAPLPPSRRSNQAGNPRHALPFAEREQVVGEIVVASRSRTRAALLALSRLPLRRQVPCASQLSENAILIPSIGAEKVEKAALSIAKRSGHEAVIQRPPRVARYRQDKPRELLESVSVLVANIAAPQPVVDGLPRYAEDLRQLPLAETERVDDEPDLLGGRHRLLALFPDRRRIRPPHDGAGIGVSGPPLGTSASSKQSIGPRPPSAPPDATEPELGLRGPASGNGGIARACIMAPCSRPPGHDWSQRRGT